MNFCVAQKQHLFHKLEMGGTYGYPQFLLAERGRALLGYLQLLTGGLCFMMGILIIAFGFTTRIVIGSYTSVLEVRLSSRDSLGTWWNYA